MSSPRQTTLSLTSCRRLFYTRRNISTRHTTSSTSLAKPRRPPSRATANFVLLPARTHATATRMPSAQSDTPRQAAGTHDDLSRFLAAQDDGHDGRDGGTYPRALSELRAGRKRSHWIWFVFPQIAGLGTHPSPTARHFAVSSLAEAEAYLAHPVLGPRLREVTRAVLESPVREVGELMGIVEVDREKLRSCMTLFKRVVEGKGQGGGEQGDELFGKVLGKYFAGQEDAETVRILKGMRAKGE